MTKHRRERANNALKKVRKYFQRNNISDTELSDSSTDSQGYSHVPLRTEIPSLAKLFLEEDDSTEMQPVLDELKKIADQLQGISTRQLQQEQRINQLTNRRANSDFSMSEDDAPTTLGPVNNTNIMESLSKIPDPIKSIPTFDGNPKQLNLWLTSAQNTLSQFKPLVADNVFKIYEQSVINKLQGRARDAICMAQYPVSFNEAKKILLTALGDRQELSSYKSKLWKNKQSDSMSVHKYYQRTKYLVENIKSLAKQDKDYAQAWGAISKFIDQDALAAFISGLNEFYFGHALAARPKSLDDAYAFLCEFNSSEKIARGEKQRKEPVPQRKNEYHRDRPKPKTENAMELDPSTQSRLTLNRRNLNNNEAEYSESEPESERDSENEELNVNFQIVTSNTPKI